MDITCEHGMELTIAFIHETVYLSAKGIHREARSRFCLCFLVLERDSSSCCG